MRLRVSWTQFARELPCVLLLFSFLAAILTWEPEALVLAGLMAVTLLLVGVLKPLLRHRRPDAVARARAPKKATGSDELGVGFRGRGDPYGMPSGHSAVAFAFFAYALIWLLRRKREVEPWQRALGYGVSVPLFVLAPVLVAFQRVHTRRHSVAQVVVGAALGIALGTAAGMLGDDVLALGK
jgi:membrane-associated phospholipid phosphatase